MKLNISLVCVLVAIGSPVRAETNKDKADAAFKQGKKLMAESKFAEACSSFERSMKLDAGIGTQLNIAQCYEKWGKLARALLAYQTAEQMAKDAGDDRAPKVHDLIGKLQPLVPKLTVKLAAGVDAKNAVATIDGTVLDPQAFNQPQLVDPGPHQVEYEVDGKKKSKVVAVERGGSAEVLLDIAGKPGGGDSGNKGEPDAPYVSPQPDPAFKWKIGAYVSGGAGVVALGISTGLAISAKSKYSSALKADCMNMTNACDPVGLKATHDARSQANIATGVFIFGLAAVGGGVALYLLAPHSAKTPNEHAWYLVPSVAPDGGAVVFGGRM